MGALCRTLGLITMVILTRIRPSSTAKDCPFSPHTASVCYCISQQRIPVALTPLITEPNNKYLDPSTSSQSHLNEAKALLEQNGSLSEAALLLEAAIQNGDLGNGGYEAWILLGETRNMDEREDAGMKALMEGVRIAEEAGASGEGMLVRYVCCFIDSI